MMALEIKDLNVSLGDFSLKNINFSIERGTIHGLVGKNGAGKSTLIKTISSFIQRDSGQIFYNGISMEDNERLIKQELGVVFDKSYYNEYMKLKNLKETYGEIYPNFDKDFFQAYLEKFEIDEKSTLVKMSQGQLKKVLILLTMSLRPKILILDEPTASIDPISRKEVLDMLKDFVSDEESSVLFSTHITSDLEKLADHVAFIDKGQLILNERRDILEESYRLLSLEDGNSILENLIGPIKTAYGYRGLVATKFLKDQEGTIPSIEDLLLHFIRKGELEDEKVF